MKDLRDINVVREVKSNMHATFDTPQGKEVMAFLEQTCCWYQSVFVPNSPEMTMINDGKRQVLATIKTILALSPEQLVLLVKQKEE